MNINVEFEIGEKVWDTLTKRLVSVIGVKIIAGRTCCSAPETPPVIEYYVDNHLCGSHREPSELMRQTNGKRTD